MSDYYTPEFFGTLPKAPWVIYHEDDDRIYEIWEPEDTPLYFTTVSDTGIDPGVELEDLFWELSDAWFVEIDINGKKALARVIQKINRATESLLLGILGMPSLW